MAGSNHRQHVASDQVSADLNIRRLKANGEWQMACLPQGSGLWRVTDSGGQALVGAGNPAMMRSTTVEGKSADFR